MDAPPPEFSRRRLITLAAFTALGGALAPGALRLLPSQSTLLPATFAPPGFQFLDSPEFGLRFAVPEDLIPMHPWDLAEAEGAESVFGDLAGRVQRGMDEVMDDQFNSIDLLAVAEDATAVNVMRISSDMVPTPKMLADEIAALSLHEVAFDRIPTVFGTATTMRSVTYLFDDQVAVPGHVLWAANRRGVFSIQLTAQDPQVVDALYGILLRTLQPLSR